MAPMTLALLVIFDDRNLVPFALIVGSTSMVLWLDKQAPRTRVFAGSALVLSCSAYLAADHFERGLGLASVLSLILGGVVVASSLRRAPVLTS